MSRYGSNFKEPPWVIGSQKEVMDWMEATHPGKKDKHGKDKEGKYLKNLHVRFDFNVSHKEIEPSNLFAKLIGKKHVEEDFDLGEITEGLEEPAEETSVKEELDVGGIGDAPEEVSEAGPMEEELDLCCCEILMHQS